MEEPAPAVALPFRVGASPLEIASIKLIADAATLLPDTPMDPLPPPPPPPAEEDPVPMEDGGETDGLQVRTSPLDDEPSVGSPSSVVSDSSSIAGGVEDLLALDELGVPSSADAAKSFEFVAAVPVDLDAALAAADSYGQSTSLAEAGLQGGQPSGSGGGRSVFLREYIPLWGSVSIRGLRPEMEDAVVAVPGFFKLPLRMLTGDRAIDGINLDAVSVPSHFFGVYDGHGGAQVADYCRDRIHLALVEELRSLHEEFGGAGADEWQKQWERAFTNCFRKVDDEVSGKASREIVASSADASVEGSSVPSGGLSEPVAPETVGSTAVVAVICSSHIIIANCGDSRAVLCRGKQAVPLSVDHKPNREDEYARIEKDNGKVIQWNGYRVFGVLAMSRSIGDRYLKPWIIPDPEVTIVPRSREDECLILASDGLWDVLSNEEVCDVARRRILVWHKKNGVMASSTPRGEGADPAAQAAADHLSKLALQKGSKDNITVIVVDLKAQRKFKSKT